jgi:hypothetical protein
MIDDRKTSDICTGVATIVWIPELARLGRIDSAARCRKVVAPCEPVLTPTDRGYGCGARRCAVALRANC